MATLVCAGAGVFTSQAHTLSKKFEGDDGTEISDSKQMGSMMHGQNRLRGHIS